MEMNFKEVKGRYTEEISNSAEWFTKLGVATDRRFGSVPREEEWWDSLSPIEQDLWEVTRNLYGQYLLPQWPVNSYFLDFANPITKVAFECDGKKWHDPARDFKRDTELRRLGWTVYRIPGRVCHKHMDEPSYVIRSDEMSDLQEGYGLSKKSEDYVKEFLSTTLDGFMQCFTRRYFGLAFPHLASEIVSGYLSPACRDVSAGRGASEFDLLIAEAFARRHELPLFSEYIFCTRARQHFGITSCFSDFPHQWRYSAALGFRDAQDLKSQFLAFMEKHPYLIRLYQLGIDPRTTDRESVLGLSREVPDYLHEYAESMRCSDDED